MLNWLSSRLPKNQLTHCLGSEAALKSYLAEIPAKNPQHALAALDEWIEEPARLFNELPLPAAIRALSRLDEFVQPQLAECQDSLFAASGSDHTTPFTLRRLEKHFEQLFSAYRLALAKLAAPAGKPGNEKAREALKDADKSELARLALRAMAAQVARKKISHFSYQGANEAWWKATHELLYAARDLAILHTRLPAYPGREASSIWHEYLAGLIFEVAPLSNLTPVQMDALDAIAHWAAPHFVCVDSFSPRTPFCVRTDLAEGPKRYAAGQEASPSWRYFGPGPAHTHLVRLRALIGTGKPPDWLKTACASRELLDLLLRLLAQWSPTPPRRAANRLSSKGELRVTAGFALARRMIAASEFARSGRSLDYDSHLKRAHLFRSEGVALPEEPEEARKTPLEILQQLETAGDRQMMDTWDIIDLSAQGLGARFVFRRPWQAIGALVAYRPVEDVDWRVAILRRLGRSHGTPNAGLQVFAGIPRCAQVQARKQEGDNPWQQQTRDTSGLGLVDAIHLSAKDCLLLLPKGMFGAQRPVDLLLGGKRTPLRLIECQTSGNDYDLVLYEPLDAPPAEVRSAGSA